MATTLALAMLLVAVVLIGTVSLAALERGSSIAEDIREDALSAEAVSKAGEVAAQLDALATQLEVLAGSPATTDLVITLVGATTELDRTARSSLSAEEAALREHYEGSLVPMLSEMRGRSVGVREVMPESSAGVYLQYHYAVGAEPDLGDERDVDDAGDGSDWSAVHAIVHPRMRFSAAKLGVGDLLLVGGANRQVVYTVAKGSELGTSLQVGPLSGSNLAIVVGEALSEPGTVVSADVGAHAPAGDRPVGFLASAVTDGDRVIGALVARLPLSQIGTTMTSDGEWVARGLGETGEAHLIGPDGRLRSEARAWVEDPEAYLDTASEQGSLAEDQLRRIRVADTSVLFSEVDPDTLAALRGRKTVREARNYLGVPVWSIFEPVPTDLVDWTVIAEMSVAQAEAPIEEYGDRVVLAATLSVLVLTFGAAAWSAREVRPLRDVGARLRAARDTEPGAPVGLVPWSAAEFAEIHDGVEDMLGAVEAQRGDIEAIARERSDVLATVLPPQVASRIEAGDRSLFDSVPEATVVVAVVQGLGAIGRDRSPEHHRAALASVVDCLDGAAEAHGLQRVKLVGDSFVATCGVAQPLLDHAPRGVAFAQDARRAVRELAVGGEGLDLSIGMDSGRVEAGLSGPSRLVYEVWGPAALRAASLARASSRGELLVSARTAELLPEAFGRRRVQGDGEPTFHIDLPEREETGP